MKAKRVFRGVPTGEFYPVTYQPGDVIPPELVSAAKAVDADKELPEGSLPPKVEPTSVSQRGADGTSGRSVKGKGKGKAKADDEGGTEDNGDADDNAGTEGSGNSEDNAGSEGDGAGDDNAGSEANADDAGSGDPKLAGLG
tara:strand:- start:28592 stop:29014 length:423 start_codon:yes stop_codon:yes gene_type:complete